jgi:hypothetical protein
MKWVVNNLALGVDELERIIEEVTDKVRQELFLANRTGRLDKVLSKYGVSNKEERYVDKNAKILIIGDSQIGEDKIRKLAKLCKIDNNLLECELDYKKIERYNFNKLEYNTNYQCVLVGPMPHSVQGKEDYSSIISKMETEQEKYPEVIRVTNSNELKITKTSLKHAFEKLVENLQYQFL